MLRPDGQALVLTTDRAKNIAALDALAAGDGAAHASDVGGVEADALFALLGGRLVVAHAKLMWGQAQAGPARACRMVRPRAGSGARLAGDDLCFALWSRRYMRPGSYTAG